MPTEYEIKIHLPSKSVIDKLINDQYVTRYLKEGFVRTPMSARYYDTPDWDLYKAGYMLRIRQEGQNVVASLKKGTVDKGDHAGLCIRRKWLCTATSIAAAGSSLLNCGAPEDFGAIIEGKQLIETCYDEFTRTSAMLYMEEGLVTELSIDEGTMHVQGRDAPILEMECEIIFGGIQELKPFADGISERYGLEPELTTKYEKAYLLAHEE